MKKLLLLLAFMPLCYAQDLVLSEINPALFKTDFSEYDQPTALFCAQLSDITYWNERNISQLNQQAIAAYPEYNIQHTFIDDSYGPHHSQVLLWGTKNFLVISFRGTEPTRIRDWFTDSRFWNYENSPGFEEELSNMPAGHGGFRRSLMRLMTEKKLVQEIKSLIHNLNPEADESSFPIYLTGHSLGAALAQLFLIPLKYNKLNFKGAYHFAPPLAVSCEINHQMRKDFGSVVYDIVNYKDYVPRAGRNNVAHFGKFYRICDNGLLYKEAEAYVKFRFREYLSEFKLHSIATHIELLRKPENNTTEINQRSANSGDFPCMELKGKPKKFCD